MLGNFSIGDYFKKAAIVFAYELLVNKYEMDIHKLYFTVYDQDDETYRN
jgi:alanyl-tRNA synthetase